MAKRGGGGGVSTQGKRNQVQENDIFTHPIVAHEIFEYLTPHISSACKVKILDACANTGVLGYILCQTLRKYNIIRKGLLDCQDIKTDGQSILDAKPKGSYDIIVCNPPWVPVELAESIYWRLMDLLSKDGVLFFIINNTFCYQGQSRARKLKFQKYYFLRFAFQSAGKDLLDSGVMVYHKNKTVPYKAVNLPCFIPLTKLFPGEQFLPGVVDSE